MGLSNKSIVNNIFDEVFTGGRHDLVEKYYSADLVCEDSTLGDQIMGREEVIQALARQRNAFPNLRYTLEHAVYEGDMGAICWTATGKFEQALGASTPPNDQEFSVQGMSFLKFSAGKICLVWQQFDTEATRRDIDVVPEKLFKD